MLIALVSAKGAPGVTTTGLALTLTWPRHAVLAECDPRGGDVLAGFGAAAIPTTRGLLELQVAARTGRIAQQLWGQLIGLDGSQHWVLPGLGSPHQAAAVDWEALAAGFGELGGVDVLADCGELHAAHAPRPVWRAADVVALVTRTGLPALRAAYRSAQLLRDDLARQGLGTERLVAVLVGPERGYSQHEVAREFDRLQVPVAGTLPVHERSAGVLSQGADASRGYSGSPLMRAAAVVGQTLGGIGERHRAETRAMQRQATERSGGNGYRQGPPLGVPHGR